MTHHSNSSVSREKQARHVIEWAIGHFGSRIAVASSFSMEDIAVIHMATQGGNPVRVFAIDTGRLNEETYACAEAVRLRYKVSLEWVFPRTESVEALVRAEGLYSFRNSIGARRECCGIRKVEPLARALQGLQAWITGMRREQGVTRSILETVETDTLHGGITKINPLAEWSLDDVLSFATAHELPVNRLHDRGYASIGCAPCTRPIKLGEELRSGRWWWEDAEHKECGLHNRSDVPCHNLTQGSDT